MDHREFSGHTLGAVDQRAIVVGRLRGLAGRRLPADRWATLGQAVESCQTALEQDGQDGLRARLDSLHLLLMNERVIPVGADDEAGERPVPVPGPLRERIDLLVRSLAAPDSDPGSDPGSGPASGPGHDAGRTR